MSRGLQRFSRKVHDLGSRMLIRTIEYIMETLLDAISKNKFSGVFKEIEGSEIQGIDD